MQVKDLIVTGDAKIIGKLYNKNIITYTLVEEGTTLKLVGSDGSICSIANMGPTLFMNRTTYVNQPDTNYTTLMARGSSLHNTLTNPTVNGAICWRYQ